MWGYGIFIDIVRCIGCYACVVGCKNWHMLHNTENSTIKIMDFTTGEFPEVERWIIPIFCGQCKNAPCMDVCNTGALFRTEDGIIRIDEEKCIGSRRCERACPFGVILFNREKNKVFKCDFCYDRIKKGQNPFCVDICPTSAIHFEKISEIEKKSVFSLNKHLGTKIFYPIITSGLENELIDRIKK